jgi:hypothetical protein
MVMPSEYRFKIPVHGLSGKLILTFDYFDIKTGQRLARDRFCDVFVSRDIAVPTRKANSYFSETPKTLQVLSNNIGHSSLPFPGPFVYMTWLCSIDKHILPSNNILATIRVQAISKASTAPKKPAATDPDAPEDEIGGPAPKASKAKPSHIFLRETHVQVKQIVGDEKKYADMMKNLNKIAKEYQLIK